MKGKFAQRADTRRDRESLVTEARQAQAAAEQVPQQWPNGAPAVAAAGGAA